MKSIDDKIIAVITSCRTDAHFDCAKRYIKLARKIKAIGNNKYHVCVGMIATFKGVIKDAKTNN